VSPSNGKLAFCMVVMATKKIQNIQLLQKIKEAHIFFVPKHFIFTLLGVCMYNFCQILINN
jgi:hypothetical protein